MMRLVRDVVRTPGFDIVRYRPPSMSIAFPPDVSGDDREILERIAGYTMTGIDRQIALVQALRYLVRRGIEGCFVECGVWRGGSTMAAALTLAQEGATDRHLYLFDTFEGRTPPTTVDRTDDDIPARKHLDEAGSDYTAGIDEVRRNMASTGYPSVRVHLVKGPVEETLPARASAEPIALLRLDTDWYESTWHELVHLLPRLAAGGILIVDDYGHWSGARQALDEYIAGQPQPYYVHRIDYTGRLLVKH
jgi:hypothetical protein